MAAARPLPTLPVTLVKLSVIPKTVFLAKLEAPWARGREHQVVFSYQTYPIWFTHSCDTNTQIAMPMLNDSLNRLVKDVLNTRADVVEQSDRISKEIG